MKMCEWKERKEKKDKVEGMRQNGKRKTPKPNY